MLHSKFITFSRVHYFIFGTREEVREFFMAEKFIPNKDIEVYNCKTAKEWEFINKILVSCK